MEYKIAFFDIDGTILNSKKKIPLKTKEAIAALKAKGIEVIIATGRSIQDTRELAIELGIESSITYNGSYILYKGKEIYKCRIETNDLTPLYEAVIHDGNAFASLGIERTYYSDLENPIAKSVNEDFAFHNFTPTMNLSEIQDVLQINLFCKTKEEVKHYSKQHTNLKFVPWNELSNCVDVLPIGSSKAKGIEYLLKYLGITKEEAIAFGDGLNDVEMLSYVGKGIAMGNAHPTLLPHADYITNHVDDDGIYFALKELKLI